MLLKIMQVAQELSIAAKTVRRWIMEGKLRGIKIGRHWQVDSDDLALFIEKRRV